MNFDKCTYIYMIDTRLAIRAGIYEFNVRVQYTWVGLAELYAWPKLAPTATLFALTKAGSSGLGISCKTCGRERQRPQLMGHTCHTCSSSIGRTVLMLY